MPSSPPNAPACDCPRSQNFRAQEGREAGGPPKSWSDGAQPPRPPEPEPRDLVAQNTRTRIDLPEIAPTPIRGPTPGTGFPPPPPPPPPACLRLRPPASAVTLLRTSRAPAPAVSARLLRSCAPPEGQRPRGFPSGGELVEPRKKASRSWSLAGWGEVARLTRNLCVTPRTSSAVSGGTRSARALRLPESLGFYPIRDLFAWPFFFAKRRPGRLGRPTPSGAGSNLGELALNPTLADRWNARLARGGVLPLPTRRARLQCGATAGRSFRFGLPPSDRQAIRPPSYSLWGWWSGGGGRSLLRSGQGLCHPGRGVATCMLTSDGNRRESAPSFRHAKVNGLEAGAEPWAFAILGSTSKLRVGPPTTSGSFFSMQLCARGNSHVAGGRY